MRGLLSLRLPLRSRWHLRAGGMAAMGTFLVAAALSGVASAADRGAAAKRATAPHPAEACPPEVRVSFPNFEVLPFLIGTDTIEARPGLLIEWVRNALARTGCPSTAVVMQRRPPNRQIAEMRMGRIDILPGFVYGQDLAKDMAYPPRHLAMMVDTMSLYARADDQDIKWDGKQLVAPGLRVGTSTGGAQTGEFGRRYHWNMELAATPLANLRKLVARRVDVILEPDVVMAPYMATPEGKLARRLAPPVHSSPRFAPVRNEFAERYPEFTRKFWLETCRESRSYFTTMPACR